MNKIVSKLLFLVLMLSLLSGCNSDSGQQDKKEIKVGITSTAQYTILPLVDRFNEENESYVVNYTIIGDMQDFNQYQYDLMQMSENIQDGSCLFDAIVAMNDEINTATSNFENLQPYIYNDDELAGNTFPNFLESITVSDQITSMWLRIGYETMLVAENDKLSLPILTLEEVDQNFEKSGYSKLFSDIVDGRTFFEKLGKAYMLYHTDFSTSTCNFNTDEFRTLLIWCKNKTYSTIETDDKNFVEISFNPYYVSASILGKLFNGYPVNGHGVSYYNNRYETISIIESSKNKEEVWAFAKYLALNCDNSPFNYSRYIENISSDLSDEQLLSYCEQLDNTSLAMVDEYEPIYRIMDKYADDFFCGNISVDFAIEMIQKETTEYLQSSYK